MPAPLRHAIALLVFLAPALASAQKPPPSDLHQDLARARAQEGLKLFGADRLTDALAAFREAESVFHTPSVTLYIARCQRKLGKVLDARTTYEQILAEDLPKDASPPFVQAHFDAGRELESLKPRIPTLRVVVTGAPAAEVQMTLNGTATDAEQKDLDPGSYTIQAQTRTHPPVTRTVALNEGSHETVTIDLSPPVRAGGGSGGGGDHPAPRWWLPGGITLGAGVLLVGAGAATGVVSLTKVMSLKSQCGSSNVCSSISKSQIDSAALFGNVSTATVIAGGVAVAAGSALLLALRPRPHDSQRGWQAGVGIGRVDVKGTF
jgi:hypothetical protein